ncbi:hypothetical protein NDU88_001089, partial [Pleurodeles waltl]
TPTLTAIFQVPLVHTTNSTQDAHFTWMGQFIHLEDERLHEQSINQTAGYHKAPEDYTCGQIEQLLQMVQRF